MPLPSMWASRVLELVLIASGYHTCGNLCLNIWALAFYAVTSCDHGSDVLAAHELFVGGNVCNMARYTSCVEVRVKCLGKSSGTLRMVCDWPGRQGRERKEPNRSHEWEGSQGCGETGRRSMAELWEQFEAFPLSYGRWSLVRGGCLKDTRYLATHPSWAAQTPTKLVFLLHTNIVFLHSLWIASVQFLKTPINQVFPFFHRRPVMQGSSLLDVEQP